MHDVTQGELIFPSPDNGSFSENAMLAVLDRLGHPQMPCRFRCRLALSRERSVVVRSTSPREERGIKLLGSAPKHATLLEINASGYQPKELLIRADIPA